MLRFLGLLVILAAAFGLGYIYGTVYGMRPLGILEPPVKALSRSLGILPSMSSVVIDTAGVEDLGRQRGLIEAKARIVQAKSALFQKNTKEAVKELAEAVDSLENASGKQAMARGHLREITEKIRQTRLDLLQGKKLAASRLDEVQKEVDALLGK